MAVLLNTQNQQRCLLQSHHSFGRLKESVNTCVLDPYVSKIHAFIEWNGQHWLLRDVSSNGTWLNDNKIAHDQLPQLKVGDTINLASKSGYGYQVLNINPPSDCLVPIEHASEAIELEPFHLLSKHNAPQLVLSYNRQTYSWWQEIVSDNFDQEESMIELSDREYLNIDGLTWQLRINQTMDDTFKLQPNIASLDELTFKFQTSLDEEATQITIHSNDQTIDLLIRSHHYLTLSLARQRAEDIKSGIDESEQGWVYAEELAKNLGLDASHINIQIYRIRKQFVDALSNAYDSSNIIERRVGKLRLAAKYFTIIKGDHTEFDTSQPNQYKSQHIDQHKNVFNEQA